MFAGVVSEGVRKDLGEGYQVSVITNLKNNSLEMTGIMIKKEDEKVAPTIYIDDLLQVYNEKKTNLHEIVKEVISRYQKSMGAVGDIYRITIDWEYCKDKIVYRLISREKNEKLLEEVPYIPFLDLAITFHVIISINESCMQSIKISNDLQREWNVPVEQILKKAKENTEKILPLQITPLHQMVTANEKDYEKHLTNHKKMDMIVVTNHLGVNGAAVILYDGVIEKMAAEYNSNLYVIPSSVHEMIIVPAREEQIYPMLSVVVKDINVRYVEKEEILSDRVYIYLKDEKKFI